jgi:hypothetical protein
VLVLRAAVALKRALERDRACAGLATAHGAGPPSSIKVA